MGTFDHHHHTASSQPFLITYLHLTYLHCMIPYVSSFLSEPSILDTLNRPVNIIHTRKHCAALHAFARAPLELQGQAICKPLPQPYHQQPQKPRTLEKPEQRTRRTEDERAITSLLTTKSDPLGCSTRVLLDCKFRSRRCAHTPGKAAL